MTTVTYKVNCPRDLGKVYTMTILLAKLENGTYLPAPCNGCENSNGSSKCEYCMESLFKMSLEDPTMQSFKQPIST